MALAGCKHASNPRSLSCVGIQPTFRREYRATCYVMCSIGDGRGFISLIPGGAGVREYIILALLGPTLGATGAILAAVALRLVWLVTEVLLAIGSIIVMRQQRTIRNT